MDRKDIKYCLFIVGVVLISYFELVLNIFSTKWDNLSAFFPYRYTAMHWWRSGHIPFWDFYQNMGYPMHANPQGAAWYPITWLFELFGEYSQYSMNLEVVLHIIIAGIGMYFFLNTQKINKSVGTIGAIGYALSGFISGTNHMIGFIAGAAWLPWCVYAIVLCYQNPTTLRLLFLAVVSFFQITGAYSAFSIIIAYVYLGYGIYALFSHRLSKDIVIRSFRILAIAGSVTLVLCSPYLYSIYDSLPYFSRASPLAYSTTAFENNFSWQCLQSLVVPYVISAKEGFRGVDISLTNVFFGLPLLVAFILYVIRIKDRLKCLKITLLLLSLFLALGNHTPVHQFIFHILPGFDLFRHPYLFSLYFIFLAIVLATRFIQEVSKNSSLKKLYVSALKVVIITLGILAIYSFAKTDFSVWDKYIWSINNLRERSPLNNYGHAFFNIAVLLPFYIGYFFIKNKTSKHLLYLIAIELIMCIQLNAPLHMFYNEKPQNINAHLEKISNKQLTNQNYNTPLDSLRNSNIEPSVGLWVNLNTFSRTTGSDGYNPFIYSSYERLKDSDKFGDILKKGIVSSQNNLSSISDFKLDYNSLSFQCTSKKKDTIHISQNYHHNWKATNNGKQISVSKSQETFMTVHTAVGPNNIVLKYDNKVIVYLLYISIFSLFLTISCLIKLRLFT
ncbi:YfhO family protein [Bacteroidia bacterium]|nr:YfhO family protein [Bacteroidia bacterium]MDC1395665.1 YfhO family protein [Bacteroidia bacterium]